MEVSTLHFTLDTSAPDLHHPLELRIFFILFTTPSFPFFLFPIPFVFIFYSFQAQQQDNFNIQPSTFNLPNKQHNKGTKWTTNGNFLFFSSLSESKNYKSWQCTVLNFFGICYLQFIQTSSEQEYQIYSSPCNCFVFIVFTIPRHLPIPFIFYYSFQAQQIIREFQHSAFNLQNKQHNKGTNEQRWSFNWNTLLFSSFGFFYNSTG